MAYTKGTSGSFCRRHRKALLAVFLAAAALSVLGLSSHAEGQDYGIMGFTILSRCNIYLVEGWNFMSICANVTNTSITSVLAPIDGKYRYVMEWDESSQEFDIYSPLSASPPFEDFNLSKSYFIFFEDPTGSFGSNAPDFEDLSIDMIYGWNTPTWPYTLTSKVENYLSTIAGDYRYMMKWNASDQEFMIYSPLSSDPPFTHINQGEGQFISVSNPSGVTLAYNKSNMTS
jgi:hypothetical protein